MLNRKLLEVLKRLNETQRKRLRQFLTSPYFNHTSGADNILRLYDRIVQFDAEELHPELDKATVSNILFPEYTYREKAKGPIDAVASDLFRLVRQFIGQQAMEQENGELREHLAMARFYRKHALEERFWQSMQAARKEQAQFPWLSAEFYYQQFRLEEEENAFRGMYNAYADGLNLGAANRNLDLFYCLMKLELTGNLEHQKRHTHIEEVEADELVKSVLKLSNKGGPLDVPVTQIYHLIIRILKDPDDDSTIGPLEQLLEIYRPQIPPEKFNEFMAYCRFYWSNHYQKLGTLDSRYHVLEIYVEHLKKGYLYIDGAIPYTTSRNLVVFALKLGKLEWVEQFLKTHPPECICGTRYPVEIHSLNTAEYYFALQQYDNALDTLVYRHFEHPGMGITADLLLIKIYYETQSDLLAPRMKALDQKVRRTNKTEVFKERYLNFLRKLDKIIKYGWQKRSDKRQRLIEEIKSTQEIVAREWLLEQLEKR